RSETRLDGLRILWIDDHPANNITIERNLTSRGAQVAAALNIDEAVAKVPFLRPNVVVSDVERDGVEDAGFVDAERLRRHLGYEHPILFYTSHVGPEHQRRIRALAPASITVNGSELVEWIENLSALISQRSSGIPGTLLADTPWLRSTPT